jgi:hypothetical protein
MKDHKDLIDATADLLAHYMGDELLQVEYSTEPLPHLTTMEARTGGDRTIRLPGSEMSAEAGVMAPELSVAL